ncbi:MAG: carboxymuconolactone decarboxylase family protein [Gammaproteobacteria bacterium]|nr:MAG: carboxymuconolactone decarboxylase family protein [Gammaproteobacteria bacterium]HDY81546.1 carboxymuconolactone decarboxylase family protein [Halieaceae bacterium]
MRLSEPRITPLPESEWSDDQRALVTPLNEQYGFVFNVMSTLMRNMPLLTNWNGLAMHLVTTSTLDAKLREMVIMRVGFLTDCEYEWGQHVLMSESAGLTPDDHSRIKLGATAPGWTEVESAVLLVTDELIKETMISDKTWDLASAQLDTEQLTDLIFTIGQYNMLAMALNSLGVQREPGVPGFDG